MKARIDVYAGLLGAGKTTLIKQMLATAYKGMRVALIENEIGAVNFDAGEIKENNLNIRQITNGCICCSVTGSFVLAMEELVETQAPEVILVEPSGVADLGALLGECRQVKTAHLGRVIMVVNTKKTVALLKVAGQFYAEQLNQTPLVYLNRTEGMTPQQVEAARASLLGVNPGLMLVDTPMAAVDETTFPMALWEDYSAEDVRPAKTSLLAEEQVQGRILMRPGNKAGLSDWLVTFDEPFSEVTAAALLDQLKDPALGEVWRVKGILLMEDGSHRKVDVVFGDSFEKTVERDQALVNKLVIIGRNLNRSMLQPYLEKQSK